MSPPPDNTEPAPGRRSTDRRITSRELFEGTLTQAEVDAAFDAASADLAADEAAMVRVRAKFAALPPADA